MDCRRIRRVTSAILPLTSENRDFIILNAIFERMLAGFEIIAPPIQRPSLLSGEVFIPVAVLLVTGGSMGALAFPVLHPRRPKNSSVELAPSR